MLSDDVEIKKRISIDLEHGGLVRYVVMTYELSPRQPSSQPDVSVDIFNCL